MLRNGLLDSELQDEKSSWNTKKKSNEGAQVKKGLKTPYCRVGERPGLCVYIYMYVSENSGTGTPKTSILMGFSTINHPLPPNFWKHPYILAKWSSFTNLGLAEIAGVPFPLQSPPFGGPTRVRSRNCHLPIFPFWISLQDLQEWLKFSDFKPSHLHPPLDTVTWTFNEKTLCFYDTFGRCVKTACISTGLRSPSALVARCSMITFATACCSVFRKRRRFSWQGGTTVGFGDWWVGGIRLLKKNGTNWKVGETSHTITKQISYNEKLKVTHNIRKSKENSKKVRKVKHG